MEAFGLSDPGCVRRNNEDFYLLLPKAGLYVVADGMGGAQAGEHASKLAIDTVAAFVEKSGRADAEMLGQAFQEASDQGMTAAAGDATWRAWRIPLVAALKCRTRSCHRQRRGQPRLRVRRRQVTSITEDQTWVHEVGRRLGMDALALRTHPMRHVLTMAIGVSPELRVHWSCGPASARRANPAIEQQPSCPCSASVAYTPTWSSWPCVRRIASTRSGSSSLAGQEGFPVRKGST